MYLYNAKLISIYSQFYNNKLRKYDIIRVVAVVVIAPTTIYLYNTNSISSIGYVCVLCEHEPNMWIYISLYFFLHTYPYIAQATCNPLSLYSFGVRRLLTTSKQNITLLPVVVVYTNDNMNDTHTHMVEWGCCSISNTLYTPLTLTLYYSLVLEILFNYTYIYTYKSESLIS